MLPQQVRSKIIFRHYQKSTEAIIVPRVEEGDASVLLTLTSCLRQTPKLAKALGLLLGIPDSALSIHKKETHLPLQYSGGKFPSNHHCYVMSTLWRQCYHISPSRCLNVTQTFAIQSSFWKPPLTSQNDNGQTINNQNIRAQTGLRDVSTKNSNNFSPSNLAKSILSSFRHLKIHTNTITVH